MSKINPLKMFWVICEEFVLITEQIAVDFWKQNNILKLQSNTHNQCLRHVMLIFENIHDLHAHAKLHGYFENPNNWKV